VADAVEVAIILAAKDAASGVLSGIGGQLDKLGKSGDLAKLALGGLTAGLGAAVLAGVDFARAAADEEQGIFRLAQAVSNAGGNWDELQGTIEDQIATWEKLTAFSDGEMRDSLSLLSAQTGDVDEAMKRLPIAMDFARGAGIDLATASKLLGKVTDETTNVLGRYGIHVEKGADATRVLEDVQKRFGGQSAAYVGTAAGQWQIFQNQMDNLKEDVGAAILPAFTGLAQAAVGVIEGLRAFVTQPAFLAFFGNLGQVVSTAKDIFVEMFGVITGSAPAAGETLKRIVGPEIAGAIMQSLAFIRELFKAVLSGDVPAIFATLKDRASSILNGLLGFVRDSVPKILDALLAWAKEFIAWIGPQIGPMLNELLGLLTSALHWLNDHAEEIGQTLIGWGLKFGEFILTTAIPAILEHLPGILLTIGKWVFTEAIPGVIGFFVKLGIGMIEGLMNGLGGLKDAIVAKVVAALGDAIKGIKDFLGIHSPSTVFEEMGLQVMAGFAQGVVKNKQLAFDALDSVYSRINGPGSSSIWGRGGGVRGPGGFFERNIDPADIAAGWRGHGDLGMAQPIVVQVEGEAIARAMGRVVIPGAALAGQGL
jgi:hypothetical protein